MSLDVLLWTFLASFAIHVVDETTMNGGFVRWMQVSFWPDYTAEKNFWFNLTNAGRVDELCGSPMMSVDTIGSSV